MKQIFRKTILLLFGGLFVSSAAWATTEVSATTFLGASSSQYTIEPNKTLTISFTSSTGASDIWNAWVTILKPTDTTFDNANTSTFYTLLRSDIYGWGDYYDATKISGTDPAGITNAANTNVTLTIVRKGSLVQTYVKATQSTNTYYQYYHNNIGDGTQDIGLILSVDNATLNIDDVVTIDDTTVDLNHLYVGNSDFSTSFWSAFSDTYVLGPNKSMKLRFKNYSSKANNWNNWSTYVTTDFNRNSGGDYVEYFSLRADNWNSVADNNTGISSNFNWASFKEDMDGATVTLIVTRSGTNVTVRCDIAPKAGGSYFEEFTQACGDGSQNIRVFLTVDGAYLDILPESIEIGDIGWGTFASDYNLDFSKAQDGLSAYAITGRSGSAITKEAVTGIVPAGTPLLVSGTANASYTVPVATTAGSAPAGNLLKAGNGSAVGYVADKTRYVLSANAGTPVFKKLAKGGSSATVPAGKAYLEFDGDVSARELTFDFDSETTAISELTNTNLTNYTNEYFNLAGQRVANPTKGLYIVNGRKVIIK